MWDLSISYLHTYYNKIKKDIREKLGKYFYKETESKPMIIIIVQEVQ